MIYAFDDFVADTDRRELRRAGVPVHVEPQVFDLLVLLVMNHHRVLSRDEIVEKIWHGRIVSESAISSRVRDLRRALDDSARARRFVGTLRGRGFRFVGKVELQPDDVERAPHARAAGSPPTANAATEAGNRPSIAVLPFQRAGDMETFAAIEEAFPRELISTLASLRWIKVISHGSSFRFRGSGLDLERAGRILGARYCLTGVIEVFGGKVTIDTELSDARNGMVVWAMRRNAGLEDIHMLRNEIAASVVAVTEREISEHEASSLDYLNAENLDAWSAMHVGIQHMNQFSRQGNQIAERMLSLAIEKDPRLARAYAGLAFVRFQNAFMHYVPDTRAEADLARALAAQSLALQPRDPFCNFMMGRCHWLNGDPGGSKPWFDRSVDACPNYTWGHYGSSWADVFTGEYDGAMDKADRAITLSPLDPMRPGMTGNKMWVYIARGDFDNAVKWAEIAARTPWAHAGMAMFAAMSHWLAGDERGSHAWMAEVRRRNPKFDLRHLLTLVPSSNGEFRELVTRAAKHLSL